MRKFRAATDWPTALTHDAVMALNVTDQLAEKQGRSTGRMELTDANGQRLVVYLKRHYRLPKYLTVLARCFPRRAWSPGMQEWEHLTWAAAQGLPVPRPVAAGEAIVPGVGLQSWLAVEELTGMIPLHEAIPLARRRLTPRAFVKWKRTLSDELARLSAKLHGRGAFHKDLYLCHFFIAEDDTAMVPNDWCERVKLIDFHRLARHGIGRLWFRVKDLGQLLFSSAMPEIDDRDRLRFWRGYVKSSPTGLFARLVRLKGAMYARHNRKRSNRT